MSDHPNAILIRKAYEAFGAGDMNVVREILSDHIVWHTPGNNLLSGDYRGADEIFRLLATVGQETKGSFSHDIHDLLANDDHVTVLVTQRAERKGRRLAQTAVQVWHVEDGKATEFWGFCGTRRKRTASGPEPTHPLHRQG
jgi:ketosteroid isomerase-like protein